MFFASRGVFPDALVDIVRMFCRSKRHALCIHHRVTTISRQYQLYSVDQRAFNPERIATWIRTQEIDTFVDRLRFTNAVLKVIQQVSARSVRTSGMLLWLTVVAQYQQLAGVTLVENYSLRPYATRLEAIQEEETWSVEGVEERWAEPVPRMHTISVAAHQHSYDHSSWDEA